MKFFSTYQIFGRLIPTIIVTIPFFEYYYFFMPSELSKFLEEFLKIEWIQNFTVSVAVIFLAMMLIRYLSKSVFEDGYFKKGLNFPTTNHLMLINSDLSSGFKAKLRTKIKKDFDIELPDKYQELSHETKCRKTISEAVSLIRTKVGSGKLLLQHNIEYGFFRNLIGGSIVALPMTIAVLILSAKEGLVFLILFNLFLLILYAILLITSKQIMSYKGNLYSRILFQEYYMKD